MGAPAQPLEIEKDLLLRARVVGGFAELLAGAGGPGRVVKDLRDTLRELGHEVSDLEMAPAAAKSLERGTVPLYETSYEGGRGSPGGATFQMADIAGFYRAFGFEVSGERPDHLVPELEFLALVLMKEAYARISGDAEGAEVCATARGKFVAEHLGAWLPEFGERVRGTEGGEPVARLVQTVLELAQAGYDLQGKNGRR